MLQSPFAAGPGSAVQARGSPPGPSYPVMSSTPFGPGVPISARPPKTEKNRRRADRRRAAPREDNDSLDDAARTAGAELRKQLGEVEGKLKACEVLGVASCPQHQQLLSDQLRLLREIEASRSPGARLRQAKKALDAACAHQEGLKSDVAGLQARLSELAKELKDAEEALQRADQDSAACQQTYQTHLAAMPQDVKNTIPSGTSQPNPPFDATVQFAFLVENGADAAMSLVSRAVAAATRTSSSAALDTESQERVKDAIREHLRHAGLIPPVDAGDPAATPTPTPGGAQPQDTPKKKEVTRKRRTGKLAPTPSPAKRAHLLWARPP